MFYHPRMALETEGVDIGRYKLRHLVKFESQQIGFLCIYPVKSGRLFYNNGNLRILNNIT